MIDFVLICTTVSNFFNYFLEIEFNMRCINVLFVLSTQIRKVILNTRLIFVF